MYVRADLSSNMVFHLGRITTTTTTTIHQNFFSIERCVTTYDIFPESKRLGGQFYLLLNLEGQHPLEKTDKHRVARYNMFSTTLKLSPLSFPNLPRHLLEQLSSEDAGGHDTSVLLFMQR